MIKKNINSLFIYFLAAHAVVWTVIPSISNQNLPLCSFRSFWLATPSKTASLCSDSFFRQQLLRNQLHYAAIDPFLFATPSKTVSLCNDSSFLGRNCFENSFTLHQKPPRMESFVATFTILSSFLS